MNEQLKGIGSMLDRSDVEAVLARVAVAAFTYYPEKSVEEPGYTIDEDIEWSMERARALEPLLAGALRRRIAEVISDPSADRRAFVADLLALAAT